eukprot:TRINITY_DN12602_c0_g1_i1.p1 TRINITY_DN12602_c0_g1~~TRINITY_DN12602_c0_g1_i1.p1  ORF type:complete len:558 (+),score=244.01 TRINITY_DN12602_c0_g1_i1:139-1812(+)
MERLEKPSENETRYDRGMRLWGAEGQKALEDSHICLLGASAVGTEALKNLVLPGVGRVTVVDGGVVSLRDLGRNFFVTQESVGQPRAAVVAGLLLEMNPRNVRADTVQADPEKLIEEKPQFFRDAGVHCVIACGMREAAIAKIAQICTSQGVHLVALHTNGMLGMVSLQAAAEHSVVEGYPDTEVADLRVTNPFPELKEYFNSFDLEGITDTHEHSHVPWVVVAHQATLRWQAEQQGNNALPSATYRDALVACPLEYKQRKRVKEILQGMRRSKQLEGGAGEVKVEEENFAEAADNINTYLPLKVPGALAKLFDSPKCEDPPLDGDVFWVLLKALRAFYQEFGVLPHSGTIPDMTSTTANYTALRNVYREEALRNRDWVKRHASLLLERQGQDTALLNDEYIAKFCRNARSLRVVAHPRLYADDGRPAYTDATRAGCLLQQIREGVDDARWVALHWASQSFHAETHRLPGSDAANLSQDAHELARLAKQMFSGDDAFPEEYVKEWVRGAYAELHTVAAVVGGVASQEVIKLVTRQRIPVDNTLVYNGVVNSTSVVRA